MNAPGVVSGRWRGLTRPVGALARSKPLTRVTVALLLVAAVLLAATPYVADSYTVYVLSIACVLTIGTLGLDITAGMSGQLSLGHAGFYGLGAYATAVMIRGGASPTVGVAVGVGVALLAGVLVGGPLTRLKGHYFAMATLAFGLIMVELAYNLRSVTNGGAGLTVNDVPGLVVAYWSAAGVMLVAFVAALILRDTWVGLAWQLLRHSESAAASSGINVPLFRLLAVVVGAGFAGLAGGMYVLVVQYVSPEPFGLATTVFFFAAVMIGGPGSAWGPAVAGFLLAILTYALGDLLALQELIYGLVILLVVLVLPRGLAGGLPKLQLPFGGVRR